MNRFSSSWVRKSIALVALMLAGTSCKFGSNSDPSEVAGDIPAACAEKAKRVDALKAELAGLPAAGACDGLNMVQCQTRSSCQWDGAASRCVAAGTTAGGATVPAAPPMCTAAGGTIREGVCLCSDGTPVFSIGNHTCSQYLEASQRCASANAIYNDARRLCQCQLDANKVFPPDQAETSQGVCAGFDLTGGATDGGATPPDLAEDGVGFALQDTGPRGACVFINKNARQVQQTCTPEADQAGCDESYRIYYQSRPEFEHRLVPGKDCETARNETQAALAISGATTGGGRGACIFIKKATRQVQATCTEDTDQNGCNESYRIMYQQSPEFEHRLVPGKICEIAKAEAQTAGSTSTGRDRATIEKELAAAVQDLEACVTSVSRNGEGCTNVGGLQDGSGTCRCANGFPVFKLRGESCANHIARQKPECKAKGGYNMWDDQCRCFPDYEPVTGASCAQRPPTPGEKGACIVTERATGVVQATCFPDQDGAGCDQSFNTVYGAFRDKYDRRIVAGKSCEQAKAEAQTASTAAVTGRGACVFIRKSLKQVQATCVEDADQARCNEAYKIYYQSGADFENRLVPNKRCEQARTETQAALGQATGATAPASACTVVDARNGNTYFCVAYENRQPLFWTQSQCQTNLQKARGWLIYSKNATGVTQELIPADGVARNLVVQKAKAAGKTNCN